MKKLILFVLTVISLSTEARALPMQLYCISEIPSTTFLIDEEAGKLQVQVLHHFGAKYAPMYNGMVTPNDLLTLKPRAEATAKLPAEYHFLWPIQKCTFHDAYRFECFGSEDVKTINGIKLEPYAVHSSIIDKNNIAGKYRELELNLSVRVDGVDTMISMQYPIADCSKQRR